MRAPRQQLDHRWRGGEIGTDANAHRDNGTILKLEAYLECGGPRLLRRWDLPHNRVVLFELSDLLIASVKGT